MSSVRRLSKNIASLVTIEVINQITAVILALLLPRYLGAAGFGEYSFVMSFTYLFLIFLDAGLKPLTILEISREKSLMEKYFNNIASIKIVLSCITFIAIFIISILMNYPIQLKLALYILSISYILFSFSDLFRSIFYASERMEYGTITISTGKIIITVLAVLFLILGYGIVEIMFAYLIGNLLALILNFRIYIKKFAKPKLEFNLKFAKTLMISAFPFGLAIAFNNVFFNFDIVMITQYWGSTSAGWFALPFYVLAILITLLNTISAAFFPSFSKFHHSSKNLLKNVYKKSFRYILILCFPIPVVLFMTSNGILPVLFGNNFVNSISIFNVLIWLLIPIALARFLEVILATINKQKVVTFVLGAFSLTNIALDIILIPKIGILGALIATSIAQTGIFIVDLFFVSKFICYVPIHKLCLKPLLACLVVIVFISAFHSVNSFLLAVLGLLIYYITLFSLKEFDNQDFELIKRIFKPQK